MITLLALALSARADAPDNYTLKLDGYYRMRGHAFGDLFEGQEQAASYMQHRVRLQPELDFEGRAKFILMADALDDVLMGDNAGLMDVPLFTLDPSNTGINGTEVPSVNVKRAWMEFKIPVGVIRAGRQASNWGMGVLSNDGNGFDDTFGENHLGSTTDRVIFATKPITVATTLAGKPKDVPLIAAVGVDRLVEDPLIQYYGYACAVGANLPGCEPTENHGITERLDPTRRSQSWWADSEDDVWEMVYVLRYQGEDLKLGGRLADLTVGTYVVNRKQAETDSDVLIVDGYGKLDIGRLALEGEAVHIGGETRALSLSNADNPEDPLYKKADIWGYAARAAYQEPRLTAQIETGYASGDATITDGTFSGRPLHPDYNVGLLLYEEIMARVTRATWGDGAIGLWSNGGVYNSHYVFPNLRWRPIPKWEIIAAGLVAWPDDPDGANIRCGEGDANCTVATGQRPAQSSILGWEGDLALKMKFHDHVNLSMEGGYAHATDRVPLRASGLAYHVDDDGGEVGDFWTFQTRVAYEF